MKKTKMQEFAENNPILTAVILIITITVVGLTVIFWPDTVSKAIPTTDSIKFKEEYEAINGSKNESTNKEYLSLSLKEANLMKYSTYEEIFKVLEDGTGIIYFGFATCPWCRNIVPILSESAVKAGIEEILYLNILNDRDTREVINGKIITTFQGTKNYENLVKILYDDLPTYAGLGDPRIKRIYMPMVVFVKDGKILGIEQSLQAFASRVQENPHIPMNDAEKETQRMIFNNYYNLILKK